MFPFTYICWNNVGIWVCLVNCILFRGIISTYVSKSTTFDIENDFRIQNEYVIGTTSESCRNKCVLRCLDNGLCAGINYNSQTGTCEMCSFGLDPVNIESNAGWEIITTSADFQVQTASSPTSTTAAPTTSTTAAPTTTTTAPTTTTAAPTTTTAAPTTSTTAAPTTSTTAAPTTTTAAPTTTTAAPTTTTAAPGPATTPSDPEDCYDVLAQDPSATSGIEYAYVPSMTKYEPVHCDMDTDGGGWTVFQYRVDDVLDFNVDFASYRDGFDHYSSDSHWLGLKYIHAMTQGHSNELYIQFTDTLGESANERFDDFSVGAGPAYQLSIGTPTFYNDTSAVDETMKYNDGASFTTIDNDVDENAENCATVHMGGWWFNNCTSINPNGEYTASGTPSTVSGGLGGMIVPAWKGFNTLQSTKFMFRRRVG